MRLLGGRALAALPGSGGSPSRGSRGPSARSTPPRCRRSAGTLSGSGRSTFWRPGAGAIAGWCPGVTNRCSRSSRESRRVNAASTARLAQSNRGRGLVRRSTATSCRSTSNSTSFVADDRPCRTNQPTSRRKIRYSSRNAMTDDHAPMVGIRDRCRWAARCRVLAPHRHPDTLPEGDQPRLKAVMEQCPELRAAAGHVRAFGEMLTELQGQCLQGWIAAVRADDLSRQRQGGRLHHGNQPHRPSETSLRQAARAPALTSGLTCEKSGSSQCGS